VSSPNSCAFGMGGAEEPALGQPSYPLQQIGALQ